MRPGVIVGLIIATAVHCAAEGSTLALVQSKDLEPYQRASKSFESTIGGTVRRFDLTTESEAEVIAAIRKLGPALIVAVGTDALRVAVEKLSDLPLVFLMVLEAQPHPARMAPVSGVTLEVPAQAQIDALKMLRPDLKTIGAVYDPAQSGSAVERLAEAAARSGVTLLAKPVGTAKQAMSVMPDLFEQCDAFIVMPDRTTAGDACFELAVLLSLRHRVPLFSPSRKYVEKGALAAFSTSYEDVGAQAAEIARRLLAGKASPESATPRMLSLVVNGTIAGKIGIAVPKQYQGRQVEVLS
jgi:putative ABC transport system substrate-binding protein